MADAPEPFRKKRGFYAPESQLVSCFAYCGGYRWHWKQTHDSFPGQPVVLVHGLVITSLTLVPLAEAITGWAPVLVPDLPGFGLSTGASKVLGVSELAAALAEWMRVAGASPAHVVGNSFGSQIAVELAARFPRSVRSLTLVGPTLDPAARGFRDRAARLFSDLPQEPFRLWKEHARDSLRGTGWLRAVATLREMLRDPVESKFPQIAVPALVLRGGSDPIAPESWTDRAARLLPDARAFSLRAGAHCVHYSHPALVACALRRFTFPLRHR